MKKLLEKLRDPVVRERIKLTAESYALYGIGLVAVFGAGLTAKFTDSEMAGGLVFLGLYAIDRSYARWAKLGHI